MNFIARCIATNALLVARAVILRHSQRVQSPVMGVACVVRSTDPAFVAPTSNAFSLRAAFRGATAEAAREEMKRLRLARST